MMNVFDPVGQGLVASLAHPGENVTGVVFDESAEVSAKRLQFLRDAVPGITHVAVLTNLDVPYARVEWNALEGAAQLLSMTLRAIIVRHPNEYQEAFEGMVHERPDALFVAAGNELNFANRRLVTQLASKNRLPTGSNFRETTESGGLISYGSVRTDRFRQAAILVGKILKGAKPADLPVEQPSKYELVINLKTARLLNLEIPRDLPLVAEDVIE
jgi:putative ABC transport system substrate-binding protein